MIHYVLFFKPFYHALQSFFTEYSASFLILLYDVLDYNVATFAIPTSVAHFI